MRSLSDSGFNPSDGERTQSSTTAPRAVENHPDNSATESQRAQRDPGNFLPHLLADPHDEIIQLRTMLARERAAKNDVTALYEKMGFDLKRANSELRQSRLDAQGLKDKLAAEAGSDTRFRQQNEFLATRVKTLQEQLVAADQKAEKLQADGRKNRRIWMLSLGVVGVFAMAAGGMLLKGRTQSSSATVVAVQAQTNPEQGPTERLAAEANVPPIRSVVSSNSAPPPEPPTTNSEQEKLKGSLARVAKALSLFKGQSAEDVFKAVNAQQSPGSGKVCGFSWSNGRPSLMVGFTAGKVQSIANSVDQCAQAVERYKP